ncbi:2-phospho-L-lactate guanylyltransferase [Streptomyces cinereospinus]
MQWTLVIPVKSLARAKSRLADAAGDGLRPGLALAFAQDTVARRWPARRCGMWPSSRTTRWPGRELAALGARVVADEPGDGLNAALAHGAAAVRARRPACPVAALNADLPALRPAELARVLDAAAEFPRAFLPDAAAIGTTLLAAAPGQELSPAFGTDSRARHRSAGAAELRLAEVDSVRQDVDTADDLRAALALGVGPRTAAAARLLIPGQ